MPAHDVDAVEPSRAAVPLAGVLLALLMVTVICLLSIGAADSSVEPGDGWAATPSITAE